MAQALMFINGDLINRKVTADDGLVDRLIKANKGDTEILDELYWNAFGRPPSLKERAADLTTIRRALATPDKSDKVKVESAAKTSDPAPNTQQNTLRRRVFEDMLWVLLNSKEFLFNH